MQETFLNHFTERILRLLDRLESIERNSAPPLRQDALRAAADRSSLVDPQVIFSAARSTIATSTRSER